MRLLRLPTDQRKETWAIMKEKRKSEDGVGRMISHAELWRVATCSRKFSWILRQRLERRAKLRVMELRNPDSHAPWPSKGPDLSERMSRTARYVEASLATEGQWPLDEETVEKALEMKKVDDATSQFLSPSSITSSKLQPAINRALRPLDDKCRPERIKRVSKWTYKRRFAAVMHGFKDEYGRSTREQVRSLRKIDAYASFAEFESAKEGMGLPTPWKAPEYKNYTATWCPRYKLERWTFSQSVPRKNYY